ncbi:anaphase-promoting complex, cyclosome, subunit 4-domain-containing protein [Aspergillus cavernicola]|uniref:Anaphase-promoting complex subunit 4 n=1 Tax=Aspergillus cavernicola TaxID=176166 RepID=A0ABR4I3K1_9EURO
MAEDGSPIQPQLTPVGEKSLSAKCKANMLTYCPTMDLIALVTEDEELHVFRLNGQKAFGISLKGDPYLDEDDQSGEIRALRWKNNGRLLAILCGNNSIRLISAYTGKTVHIFPSNHLHRDSKLVTATCLGWEVNFTDSKVAQRQLHDAAGQLTVEDLLSPDMQPSKAAALLKADLPRELALLDIESSLPRLSTLPSTGSDDDVFSSRATIDAIFHSSSKQTSDAVDVLVAGFDDGNVHIRIFDCFQIGTFQISGIPGPGPKQCTILRHASHPLSSTHAVVASRGDSLHLITLDLRFITRSGRYLSLLAHKTTQLQNLLRYICQVQRQIELEWKNAQELPARYMRSVNQDLEEKCHCDFVTAAYHLVVTGDCFEPLREFLVDIVGERGHKRWEKAVSTGYESVRRLTHECLLPALERCQVLLSRLIGLSKFQKLSEVLGLETSDLNAVVETLDCLHLLAHYIIINTNEELTQFHSFSRWLRHQIDVLSAEPMSQTLEELMEKTDLVEYPLTLKYIRGALTKSSLRNFIQQLPIMGLGPAFARPTSPSDDKWAPTGGQNRSFYDMFLKLLDQQSQASDDADPVELPKINNLTKRLGLQFEKVFGQIAQTQGRGLLHRSPLTLHPTCDKTVVDITMRYEDIQKESRCVIYIAIGLVTSKHILYIYRVVLDSANGVSSIRQTFIGAINLHKGEIRQVQFVDDHKIMVLWSNNEGSSYLLHLPFQPPSSPIDYQTHSLSDKEPVTMTTDVDVSSRDPRITNLIKHQFAPKTRPVRFDVNGRQGRRAICVLYGEGLRYEVLDLDAEMGEDEEGDE